MELRRWISTSATFAAVLTLSSALVAPQAHAADSLEVTYSKAKEAFDTREASQGDKGTALTLSLLANVAGATATTDADKAAKYRALCLLSRAYYFAGSNTSEKTHKAERLALLQKGQAAAKAAIALNANYADGNYYYAINLSRWAITDGFTTAIRRQGELNDSLRATISKKTIDGQAGDSIDGYGPLRVRGRAAYKLIGPGRNNNLSLSSLKTAAEKAPYVAANQIFYAATLNRMNKKDINNRTGKAIIEMLVIGTNSAEDAAEQFVKSFEGTPFEAAALERKAETVKDLREDLLETAGELRVKLPW